MPRQVVIRCTLEDYPEDELAAGRIIDFVHDVSQWTLKTKVPAYISIFELIISRNPPPVTVTSPPEFTSEIIDFHSFHYSTTVFEYVLPDTIDYEANIIGFEVKNLPTWLIWDEDQTMLYMGP